MKYLKLTDDAFDKLKDFVVNPFEDTPDVIVHRLVTIAAEARKRWSPFEDDDTPDDDHRYLHRDETQQVVL